MGGVGGETTAATTGNADASAKVSQYHQQKKAVVLNMSWLDIDQCRDIPAKLSVAAPLKDESSERPPGRERRIRCESVRLANNKLAGLEGGSDEDLTLATALGKVCSSIEQVRWLDLSFNHISTFGTAFSKFTGVAVLYLHSNQIANFAQIRGLGELAKLKSLTLHGNPIEDKKYYRIYVTHVIPSLTQLDFSSITHQDRENARAWATTFRKKLSGAARDGDEEYAM